MASCGAANARSQDGASACGAGLGCEQRADQRRPLVVARRPQRRHALRAGLRVYMRTMCSMLTPC